MQKFFGQYSWQFGDFIYMKPVLGCMMIIILFVSCTSQNKPEERSDRIPSRILLNDTVVVEFDLLGKIAGSAYLEKATGYSILSGKDTSKFMPVFMLSKDKDHVGLDLNLEKLNRVESKGKIEGFSWNNSKTYSMWQKELKEIFMYASREYNLDSLTGIKCGRLVLRGDLAVVVTRQYHERFGDDGKVTTADYPLIAHFLLETRLAEDCDALLKPWSLKVGKIVIEKAFFTSKNDLLKNSITETHIEDIPDAIFDCQLWMIIEKQQ